MIKNRARRNGSADLLSGSQRSIGHSEHMNGTFNTRRKGATRRHTDQHIQSPRTHENVRNTQMKAKKPKQRLIKYERNIVIIDGNLYFNDPLNANMVVVNKINGTYANIKSYLLILAYINTHCNVGYISDELIYHILNYYGNDFEENNAMLRLYNQHNEKMEKYNQTLLQKKLLMTNKIKMKPNKTINNIKHKKKRNNKIKTNANIVICVQNNNKKINNTIPMVNNSVLKKNIPNTIFHVQKHKVKQKIKNKKKTETKIKIPKPKELLFTDDSLATRNIIKTKRKCNKCDFNTFDKIELALHMTIHKTKVEKIKLKHIKAKKNVKKMISKNNETKLINIMQKENIKNGKTLTPIKSSKQKQKLIKNKSITAEKNSSKKMLNVSNKRRGSLPVGEETHVQPLTLRKNTLSKSKTMTDLWKEIEMDREDSEEKKTFDEKRKLDFDDLFDGCFSESEISIHGRLSIDRPKRMQLDELFIKFNIRSNSNLYKYFNQILKIENANDLVNYLPVIIMQPKEFQSTKIRILLAKISKFIVKKVRNGEWNGIKANEWMKLNDNTFNYIFGQTCVINGNDKRYENDMELNYIKSEICFEEIGCNKLELNSEQISFVDKIIDINYLDVSFICDVFVEELLINESGQHYNAIIGVNFYDKNNVKCDSIYISNRGVIYRNDCYLMLLSMSNYLIIENESDIVININRNNSNDIIVKFEHWRKGKLCKYNEKEILMDGNKCKYSFAKIFIEQVNGNGMYCVYEMVSKNKCIEINEKHKKRHKKKPKKKKRKKKIEIEKMSSKSKVSKKELMTLSKPKLIKKCKKYKVSIVGSKADMADRILNVIMKRQKQ